MADLAEMLAAFLEVQQAREDRLNALLEKLHRQNADAAHTPASNLLVRLRPISRGTSTYPDRQGVPGTGDSYGRPYTRNVRDAQMGPTFNIAGGALVSSPVWLQGVDEELVIRQDGPTINAIDFQNGWVLFDAVGRLVANVITYQTTYNRVDWFTTGAQLLGPTLGLATIFALQNVQPVRGVRLATAVAPVAPISLQFPTMICGG